MGLEQGRQCLKKVFNLPLHYIIEDCMFSGTSCVYVCFINVVLQWGFRRCEDICWVKTNKTNATPGLRHDSHTLFQHSKVGSILQF